MSTEFYIVEGEQRQGPFDTLAMMRRIRNGKVTADTMLFVTGSTIPLRAGEVKALAGFLSDPEGAAEPEQQQRAVPTEHLDLNAMVTDAWVFFGDNQTLTITAGAFTIGAFILSFIASAFLPAFATTIVASTFAGFALFLFFATILRKVIDQPVDLAFFKDFLIKRGLDIFICAFIAIGLPFGLPVLIGGLIGAPGYFLLIGSMLALACFSFAPMFLMAAPDIKYHQALKYSLEWVLAQGTKNIIMLCGLMFLNVIAALIFFVPVFASLSITAIALCDLFLQRIVVHYENSEE